MISPNNISTRHPRNDLTQYFYNGRSYGVGASPGLVEQPEDNAKLLSYSYSEFGYQAVLVCSRNTSSQWGYSIVVNETGSPYPSILQASGNASDGFHENYSQVGYNTTEEVVSLSGHTNNEEGILAIASGQNYIEINQTQCSVTFTPTEFRIAVDVIQKQINVSVGHDGPDVQDMDPTTANGTFTEWSCKYFNCDYYQRTGRRGLGLITSQAMIGITSITRINTSLWTSIVGDVLYQSIQNARLLNPSLSGDEPILLAITNSFESIIDDILLGLSSSQIVIAKSMDQVPVTAVVGAIRIGQASYIYAIAAVNLLLVFLALFELFRTHIWRHLLLFDYRDIKSVMVATSISGTAIADHSNMQHSRARTKWIGDPADRQVGNTQVTLIHRGNGTAIVLCDSEEGTDFKERTKAGYHNLPGSGE